MILSYRNYSLIYQVNTKFMFCLIFLILFSISLKLKKYERRKIERYLELLSKAVNDV